MERHEQFATNQKAQRHEHITMSATATFSKLSFKVVESKESNWTMDKSTMVKFSKKELATILGCIVLECNGKHGAYKALKVTVQMGAQVQEAWITLDLKSAKAWEHLDEVDPEEVIIYDLVNNVTGEVITRARILG